MAECVTFPLGMGPCTMNIAMNWIRFNEETPFPLGGIYKNLLVFFLETSNVQICNTEKEQDLRYRKT